MISPTMLSYTAALPSAVIEGVVRGSESGRIIESRYLMFPVSSPAKVIHATQFDELIVLFKMKLDERRPVTWNKKCKNV